MLYLVCRTDAIKPKGHQRTSEYFPYIVEAFNPQDAVEKCFNEPWRGAGERQYYVVPMEDAKIVTFKPRRDYEVVVENYLFGVR